MAYTATDGKRFPDSIRGRKYESSLSDPTDKAPGGPSHINAMKQHGAPQKVTWERQPMGRHQVKITHADGSTSQSIYATNEQAHSVLGDLLGVNPPIGEHAQQNARNAPVGPKENERIAAEDGRSATDHP